MRLSLVLAVAAALALSAPALAAAKHPGRRCGTTARIDGQRFAIYEEEGHAACRTVKPVIVHFLRTFKVSRPWFCALGHDSQGARWAAACATDKVLVRAYVRH
jgi:hypothetical protein